MPKLSPFLRYSRNTPHIPSDSKIDLLPLPIFYKRDTPQAVDDGVDSRIVAQEYPRREAECSRKNQKSKVWLSECKVKGDLYHLWAFVFRRTERTLTFSPKRSLISSRSSGFRKVTVLHFLIHSLLNLWSWSGKIDSTFFHGSCLGITPAPPSSVGLVIISYTMRYLSASVICWCTSERFISLSGSAARMPWSQSLTLSAGIRTEYKAERIWTTSTYIYGGSSLCRRPL